MTIKAVKFTPEVLLGAPRRSPAVPNAKGTHALYTLSTYSFEAHKKTREIRLLDIGNGQSTLVTNDEKANEPHWLEDQIVFLKGDDKGVTKLVVADVEDVSKIYVAGDLPGPVSDFKLKVLAKGEIAVAFVGQATPDGGLFNPQTKAKKHHTGLVYDSVMVRHWDQYVTQNRNAIWYGVLQARTPHVTEKRGRYTLSCVTNALKGTHLESPIPPFGDSGHFDIASHGICFIAKDPTLLSASNTKANFYYLPVGDFKSETSTRPMKIQIEGLEGACSCPVFSPNGKLAAFLQMKENGYESDKNRVILIPDINHLEAASEILASNDGKGLWDRSPGSIKWSADGRSLYLIAEEEGNGLLFKVDIPATPADMIKLPTKITTSGYLSDAYPLADDSSAIFLSSSSLIDSSLYTILDPADPSSQKVISSNSTNGSRFGLSANQVSDIWFKGAGDYNVHALVMKPSHCKEGTKYPLAYLIHGGPQSAWGYQWSTRWNMAIFAEQGYVVIAPNITGSTGYGQAFCDAIQNNWGGSPYVDAVNGFEYIEKHLHYVDTDRAVALGASYGGYMMNWIQGHPLGRKFKALVCHDGVFSMSNQLSSDEQYFPNHDLLGPPWKKNFRENWDRWDPSRYTENWATPQLVIHNERDYRLPISEGLAMFNVLQEREVESRFLTFSDENHWVLKEENSLVWHTVVLNWINKYAGLPPYKEEREQGFDIENKGPVREKEGEMVMQ